MLKAVATKVPNMRTAGPVVVHVYSQGENMPRISLSSWMGSPKLRRSWGSHQSA